MMRMKRSRKILIVVIAVIAAAAIAFLFVINHGFYLSADEAVSNFESSSGYGPSELCVKVKGPNGYLLYIGKVDDETLSLVSMKQYGPFWTVKLPDDGDELESGAYTESDGTIAIYDEDYDLVLGITNVEEAAMAKIIFSNIGTSVYAQIQENGFFYTEQVIQENTFVFCQVALCDEDGNTIMKD